MASPVKHALLSPSSSHRWLVCTPSAVLESMEPSSYSTYAEEGTEAHALAEIKLSYALGYINDDEYATRFETFRLTSKYYSTEFNEFVNDYVDEVMTIVKVDYEKEKVKVYLEEYVTFEDIVPNGGGTSDVVIVGKNFVHIIDLKFGKGVAVSAIDNPQLRLYALGAIKKHVRECTCTEAKMTIIQPRLGDITTDFVPIDVLNDWAVNVVIPKAKLAIAGQGELVPGDHCKFCKRRGKCQSLADHQLSVAQAEFDEVVVENNILEPRNMSPEMLAKALFIAPKFIDWFKEIEKYAKTAAINEGLKIPGYKLVEGRSTRVIIDPDGLAEKLHTAGFKDEDFMEKPKLLGITALEKNIGKKIFASLAEDFIVKPSGQPTLVPVTDKRLEITADKFRLTGQEFDEQETDEQ